MQFQFDISAGISVLIVAMCACSLSELMSWFLLYRKDDFKSTKVEVDKLNKKLEKLENTHVIESQNKSHEKKKAAVKAQLKGISQQMMLQSLKSNVVTGIMMIAIINLIGTYFQGIVLAKLPFEPFSMIQRITHRNLEGEDYTDCSYLFLYVLFTFIWRSNLKKLLGFEPPKPAVSIFQPPEAKIE